MVTVSSVFLILCYLILYRVDDVQLPPWAKGSSRLFIQKHRAALESDHVSRNLHYWIDLIFGNKQQGEAAVKACNVFHFLTYESTLDIQLLGNAAQREAYSDQICSFGQTPKLLFKHPHRPRKFFASGKPIGLASLITKKPARPPQRLPAALVSDLTVPATESEISGYNDDCRKLTENGLNTNVEVVVHGGSGLPSDNDVKVILDQMVDVIVCNSRRDETTGECDKLSVINDEKLPQDVENGVESFMPTKWVPQVVSAPADVIGSTYSIVQVLTKPSSSPGRAHTSSHVSNIGFQEILAYCGQSDSNGTVFDHKTVHNIHVPVPSPVARGRAHASEPSPVFLPRDCLLLPTPMELAGTFQFLLCYNMPDATFKVFFRSLTEPLHAADTVSLSERRGYTGKTLSILGMTNRGVSSSKDSAPPQPVSSRMIRGFQSGSSGQDSEVLLSAAGSTSEEKLPCHSNPPPGWHYLSQIDLCGSLRQGDSRLSCVAYAGLSAGANSSPNGLGNVVLVAGSGDNPTLYTLSIDMRDLYKRAAAQYQLPSSMECSKQPFARVLSTQCLPLSSSDQHLSSRGLSHLAVTPEMQSTYTTNAMCAFTLCGCNTIFTWTFPLLSDPRSNEESTRTQYRAFQPTALTSNLDILHPKSPYIRYLAYHPTTHDIYACHGGDVSSWDINGTILLQARRTAMSHLNFINSSGVSLCIFPIAGLPPWSPWTAFLVGYSDGVIILWLSFNRRDIAVDDSGVAVASRSMCWPGADTPLGLLLSNCYASRRSVVKEVNALSSNEHIHHQLDYICMPAAVLGADLDDPCDGEANTRSKNRMGHCGISTVQVSVDGKYVLAGRVDGSSARWRLPAPRVKSTSCEVIE